jgi:hypothetical protein
MQGSNLTKALAALLNGLGCPAQWPWLPCSMALAALLNGLGCPANGTT